MHEIRTRPIRAVLDALSGKSPMESLRAQQAVLRKRVAVFREALVAGKIPVLAVSSLRYDCDPAGSEYERTPEAVYAAGVADAEDLACWRAAEQELAGKVVEIRVVVGVEPAGAFVILVYADGSIELPETVLRRASHTPHLLPRPRV